MLLSLLSLNWHGDATITTTRNSSKAIQLSRVGDKHEKMNDFQTSVALPLLDKTLEYYKE